MTPPSSASSYRIGIDGGGTKTELILIDESGAILARHLAPGCNPSITGPERAREILTDALSTLLTESKIDNPKSKISATLLCMAGAPEFWRETATLLSSADFQLSSFNSQLLHLGSVTALDDSVPVLELATNGHPGLVLHGGTGSFVAARDLSGKNHYAGGLGWRFGDEGSGHEIGRLTIARGLLELQDCTPRTALAGLICTHSGQTDSLSVTRWFYQHPEPNRQIASLAPAALALAATGDSTAARLIHDACLPLLTLAERLAARLFPLTPLATLPTGLSGPILTHPVVQTLFRRHTALPLAPVTEPPIEGVRRLLLRQP